MKYKIERGVPIPEPTGGVRTYPFDSMAVGDSFFVPKRTTQFISTSIALAKRRISVADFTSRTVSENGVKGVRIWRTK